MVGQQAIFAGCQEQMGVARDHDLVSGAHMNDDGRRIRQPMKARPSTLSDDGAGRNGWGFVLHVSWSLGWQWMTVSTVARKAPGA
ncbi:hypothetical protein GCM10007864_48090 [Sinorhizobium fredii]|nr:hypothetical protein GCM10007864_48090 [Sinorhizobium fredii]